MCCQYLGQSQVTSSSPPAPRPFSPFSSSSSNLKLRGTLADMLNSVRACEEFERVSREVTKSHPNKTYRMRAARGSHLQPRRGHARLPWHCPCIYFTKMTLFLSCMDTASDLRLDLTLRVQIDLLTECSNTTLVFTLKAMQEA